MTSEVKKEELIFDAAIRLKNDAERHAYVMQACGNDTDLRDNVESLLQAHESQSVLDEQVIDLGITLDKSPLIEKPGTTIGRYKLLEQIGEGGMAIVYMAEQQEPIHRKVALKIIKLGMDTKSVIARFEAERQALAMMDHPNIAKVLDAGATETGRPYFVMELVKGASITDFCDANNLSTHERLNLFVLVCQAVQHAHQKGIIHRDIKPTNVMVTLHDSAPIPKVIDFGIAKAINRQLTEKTLFTRYAQIIGTPAYMSPEQAEMSGLDIDIRTDVYSLGTLLYELLTGSPPFDSKYLLSKSYEEMQRIIREEQPVKPSTRIRTATLPPTRSASWRGRLALASRGRPGLALKERGRDALDTQEQDALATKDKGRPALSLPNGMPSPQNMGGTPTLRKIHDDLDWIVMKTLDKDRDRRYDSISEFAADIKRYLNNETVLAGPPSATYRIRKFIRRRRGLFVGTLSVIATLMIGLITTSVMYYRAEHSRRKETVARAEAQTIIDFLTHDLLASVYPEKTKGQEVPVRYLLETASQNLEDKFENSPLVEAEIRQMLGLIYQKLGDFKTAGFHLERSLQLRNEQLGRDDLSTLTALNDLGLIYWYHGRYDEAEPLLVEALDARIRILGEEHPDTIDSMANLGWQYMAQSRFDEGMQLSAKVLEIGSRVLGEENPAILKSMISLAKGYMLVNQFSEAEALAIEGLRLSESVMGEEHEFTLVFMNTLVWTYLSQKRNDIVEPLAIEALEKSQRIFGNEHNVTIQAMSNLGALYTGQKQYEEGAPLLIKSVELANQVLGETQAFTLFYSFRLRELYHATGQFQKEDALLMKLLPINRKVQGENHPQCGYVKYMFRKRIEELSFLAKEQYDINDYQNALATYSHLDQMRRTLLGKSHPSDVRFIALSLFHLDRSDEAWATLNRLRVMYEYGDRIHGEHHLYRTEPFFSPENSNIYRAWHLIDSGELDKAFEIVQELAPPNSNDPSTAASVDSLSKALSRAYCTQGKCARLDGEYVRALSDYETAVAIQPVYAPPLQQLARLLATCPADEIRDGVKAVQYATEACELTQWQKSEYLDTLAAAYANVGDFAASIEWQKTAIDKLSEKAHQGVRTDYTDRLVLYESGRPFRLQSQRSLVARWEFEEIVDSKIIDLSGNRLDGKLVGDAEIIDDAERGHVLNLNGSGYVDCGNDVAFNITGPITVTVWIKVDAFDKAYQAIINKGEGTWGLERRAKENFLHFHCAGLDLPNQDPTVLTGTIDVNDGVWHHIVCVYDGMRMSLYIDGNLDGSANVGGLLNINDTSVYIGENSKHPRRRWNGLIDDVRIYNYGLSEVDVKAIYAGQDLIIENEEAD